MFPGYHLLSYLAGLLADAVTLERSPRKLIQKCSSAKRVIKLLISSFLEVL